MALDHRGSDFADGNEPGPADPAAPGRAGRGAAAFFQQHLG
ncbi:MAG TPA: hypothetical protein VN520_36430 [Streptomyces sp.]|nr:hypothetical protein [Streptomyces sp.]HWU11780.1 hypothetical protein [Streptomyces sp.]